MKLNKKTDSSNASASAIQAANQTAKGSRFQWLPELLVIMVVVFGIQFALGGYSRDIATHSDEAAHFVTGAMVYDYCTMSLGSSPLAFAEEYYARYPKVAFGHWPPAFYGLQAVWFMIAGVSKTSITILMGLVSSLVVLVLYRRIRRNYGWGITLLTMLVFLGQPLVRTNTIVVMSDMTFTLFALLAVFAFRDFIVTEKNSHLVFCVVWSVFAMWTKPVGLSLILFLPLYVLVSRQISVLFDWKIWVAVACVSLLTVPYYVGTRSQGLGMHGQSDLVQSATRSVLLKPRNHASDTLNKVVSVTVGVVAFIGAVPLFRRFRPVASEQECSADLAVAISWSGATLIFLFLVPIVSETRYLLPVLTGVMVLYANGLHVILGGFKRNVGWGLVAGVVGVSVFFAPGRDLRIISGYAAAAGNVPSAGSGYVTLVSSDEVGEGAFISELKIRDQGLTEYVLRSSKVLGKSDWSGRRYRPIFATVDALLEYVDSIPVHFILIDDCDYRWDTPLHHELLETLVSKRPDQFSLIATLPVQFDGVQKANSVQIYENLAARGKPVTGFVVDMRSKIGRKIKVGNNSRIPTTREDSTPQKTVD